MVVAGDDQVIEQMTKQLLKLVNVLKVQNLSHIPSVERELMLLKVAANRENRSRILELVQIFRTKVVDVAEDAFTLEVSRQTPGAGAGVGAVRDSANRAHRQNFSGAGLRHQHGVSQGERPAEAGAGLRQFEANSRRNPRGT